jgi:protein TonB
MIKYLVENIKYPEEAKTKGTMGTVYVTFVVEKDGSVSNVKILRGIGSGCDEEAYRVVSGMPKWKPGKQRGEAVRCQFNLPIKFSLDDKGVKKEGEKK